MQESSLELNCEPSLPVKASRLAWGRFAHRPAGIHFEIMRIKWLSNSTLNEFSQNMLLVSCLTAKKSIFIHPCDAEERIHALNVYLTSLGYKLKTGTLPL